MIKAASFLEKAFTRFHAVDLLCAELQAGGGRQLLETETWNLGPGDLVFLVRDGGALIALRIGTGGPGSGYRIAAAHTDSPGLRLRPESAEAVDGLLQVGTEVYGSPIIATWLDRDLAVAGLAARRLGAGEPAEIKPFRLAAGRGLVPNAAIHLNRDINKGFAYNEQTQLKAYLGLSRTADQRAKAVLPEAIAAELGWPATDLLGIDAWLVDDHPVAFLDKAERLAHGPRLDNLLGCHAVMAAFLAAKVQPWTQVAILYDHEEIGSRSGSGADGSFAGEILQRVSQVLGREAEDHWRDKAASFLVSVDAAHALHPSYADKHDPAYAPRLGGGLVVKTNVAHKYAGNLASSAKAIGLWQERGVKVQQFTNRADAASGSTIGPISESWLGMPTIDIGVGIWAMHSLRELGSLDDQDTLIRALSLSYGEDL